MNSIPEKNQPATDDGRGEGSRWSLLRDVGILQVKLIVDGFRDLLLVPTSLVAGIVSLVTSQNGKPGKPGMQFYHLLAFGKQSERWINLFGAVENSPEAIDHPESLGPDDIDSLVGKFEAYVVDEYKRGGVTAQAKEHLDKILSAAQRRRRKRRDL